MANGKPRLIVADDYEGLLLEISSLLAADFEVVATARDGMELIAAARKFQPDAIVTDFKMPRLNGIDAGRKILQERCCEAIVLLTVYSEPELFKWALRAGIRGYVLKVNAGHELVPAVFAALGGKTFVSSGVGR